MVGAFILMFGVAIFSYIMGNFILIIEKFKGLDSKIINGLKDRTLRGPLMVDLDAQVGQD